MEARSSAFDVALSFAGENRDYVRRVADELSAAGVEVFYDEYSKVELWGKNLYQHLSSVYRHQARYCVLFISKEYASKVWPRHELASAQARAFEENREYILPARFDDTELPGILPITGYIDLRTVTPDELARLVIEKLKLEAPSSPAIADYSGPAPPLPTPPPVIRDEPKLQALRRRLSEPTDEIEKYFDVVRGLHQAGRWSFNHGLAYPDRLLDADDRLTQRFREFSRELRSIAQEVDDRFEQSRSRTGTIFDAYVQNPLAEVSKAMRVAASTLEGLKDLRGVIKRGGTIEEVRADERYQKSAAAMNSIADKIEDAQHRREVDTATAEWLMNIGKHGDR